MSCKNCGQDLTAKYCNNCGQRSAVDRISFRQLANEVPESVFQLNHGFLFTVKELFTRPGHAIRDFLSGKRKPYYKPLAFLLITTTLYVLIAYLLGKNTFLDDAISGFMAGMEENNLNTEHQLADWISNNQAYITLIVLLLYSLASSLVFRKSKYNYFEHLVLNIYITGQQMLIYLILGFIFYKDNALVLIPISIGVTYNFWTYLQFFKNNKTTTNIALVLLTYLTFITLVVTIVFSTGWVYGKLGL